MNKRGQTLGITLISVVFIFIIGLMSVNFVMGEATTFRTAMNCADAANISDATKLLCLVGDVTVPYWIFLIFSITIGAVVARALI